MRTFVLLACIAFTLPAAAQDRQKDDAEELLSAVVQVRSKILPNARSLATLGPQRQGTGVLVREGYVLTNEHVLAGATQIRVSLADGRSFDAELVGGDPASDLAVVLVQRDLFGGWPLRRREAAP